MRRLVRFVSTAILSCAFAGFASPSASAQFVGGDLYVAGWYDEIYRVEPGSWNVTKFADAGDGLDGVSAIAFRPSGTLLCSSFFNDRIVEFDDAGNGSVLYDRADGLRGPTGMNGIAYAENGDLYVCNHTGFNILCFPVGGGPAQIVAENKDGLLYPAGIAFAPNGDLFVANENARNILRIDPSWNLSVFDTLQDDPYSIVIRGNGDIYIATTPRMAIERYPAGDPTRRTDLVTFPNNVGEPSLQLNVDGSKLYFTSDTTANLIEVDADTGSSNEVVSAGRLFGAMSIGVVGAGKPAHWSNYGTGVAGTNGVPTLTPQTEPVLGTTLTVNAANSCGSPTSGWLLLGFQQASLPTRFGGDVLLVPALVAAISFSYGGDSFSGAIPNDPGLVGVSIELQVLELDSGAVRGVSFTQGLELVFGY